MKPTNCLEVVIYQTKDEKQPFSKWLNGLRDSVTQKRVLGYIRRMSGGNLGDCKNVGGGVLEARIHAGPGFRIYFGLTDEGTLLVLLCGGDKSSQPSDIKKAQAYWNDWKERT